MFFRGSQLPGRHRRPRPNPRPGTQLAVVALSSVAVVSVGGATAATAAPLSTRAVQGLPTLRTGSTGSTVVFLQRKLKVRGTGHFGPATRAAVKRYERAHDLPADGVVAGEDWRWIGRPQQVQKLALRVAPRTSSSPSPAASEAAAPEAAASEAASQAAAPGTSAFGDLVLGVAAEYKGAPYRHGGTGPSFDCSGFVSTVFARLGYDLPRTAAGMRAALTTVSREDLVPGDLVFVYNGGGGRVGHVAIYAGDDYWYEASQPGTPLGRHHAWSRSVSYGRVA